MFDVSGYVIINYLYLFIGLNKMTFKLRFFWILLLCNILSATFSFAQEPLAIWHFDTEETSKLQSVGGVHRDVAGPRPPMFPDFSPANTAVKFDGKGSRFVLKDLGNDSKFDFTNGDSITLESWVNVTQSNAGENVYIIGKGRTFAPGFDKENQNWALRLREQKGDSCASFLFFSMPSKNEKGDWHRWTTNTGFKAGSGWHHVAVSYTFGKPESISGWIDGKKISGSWDMGGATTKAPVTDNDDIWIGSSMGGSPGNSFRGLLDDVAIHRSIVSDDLMHKRFRRVGPEQTVAQSDSFIAPTQPGTKNVQVQLHQGWSALDSWPNRAEDLDKPFTSYELPAFLFHRIPHRYDAWGIRDNWQGTVILKASTEVLIPAGTHDLLVRSKGGARLWIDGKLICKTPFHAKETGGHEAVKPVPNLPAINARPVGYGDHEVLVRFLGTGKKHQIVYETLVGGKKFRHDTGDSCVAIKYEGESQFKIVGSDFNEANGGAANIEKILLVDKDWERATAKLELNLVNLDDQARRFAASNQDAYWAKRREASKAWAMANPSPKVPEVANNKLINNEIDRFILSKVEAQLVSKQDAVVANTFHTKVLPLLKEQCFRCHADKVKGGFKLDSMQEILKSGDSGKLAVVPGAPEKSFLIEKIKGKSTERMPPNGKGLSEEEIGVLEQWIKSGAQWVPESVQPKDLVFANLTSDISFLRRAFLDTVGVPPSSDDIRNFISDQSASKRSKMIDRLLIDPRYADHWVSYWQDVLAENPNILKPTLNNTGPFRFFIYDALKDDKPMDRFVSELILMRGNINLGGSAGFAMAADNDVPMAAKAQILGTAFLGVEMQCARCHDSPFHSTTQKDLFQISAMLERKVLVLPKSSTVPAGFFEKKERESLIKATLKPNQKIDPAWPFKNIATEDQSGQWLIQKEDAREKLATIITLPANKRFAKVLVNRYWKRLMGAGIVEPAFDWENKNASHPELLDWLAHEFVASGYQAKSVIRLLMNSQAYQRESNGHNLTAASDKRFFTAPDKRRMSAEQVVDSLYQASGRSMKVEEITFDSDSRQPPDRMLNLGVPKRAWEYTSLSNERDRPSLALPRVQAVTDVLEAFGWRGARQNPITDRDTSPHVLQPAILANGTLSSWISRLSDNSFLTRIALESKSPNELADEIYLRFLSRFPTADEKNKVLEMLEPGFVSRIKNPVPSSFVELARLPNISWTNHLVEEATKVKFEMEKRARMGDAPSELLDDSWRERVEDIVWAVFNLPEFVWVP